FQAEDGIRDYKVTGVQTCALPISVRQGARLRVATKYVNITRGHFAAKGVHVDLIRLYGSMELAPLAGLADAIVDLVSTGNTLREIGRASCRERVEMLVGEGGGRNE